MPPSADIRIFLLGDFRVEYRNQPIRLPTVKSKLLLAYLALRATMAPAPRRDVALALWGGPGKSDEETVAKALASLRTALSGLRRQFGEDLVSEQVLSNGENAVQLNRTRVWVDALLFQEEVLSFFDSSNPDPLSLHLEWYRGDLLAEFTNEFDQRWIIKEQLSLRELYVEVSLALARRCYEQREYDKATSHAEAVIRLEPLNEEACRLLMHCHFYGLHDQTRAIHYFTQLCNELKHSAEDDQAVAQPETKTQALYDAICTKPRTNLLLWSKSFVGRQAMQINLKQLLMPRPLAHQPAPLPTRLVTLKGPGGSGKTHLARVVAAQLLSSYAPDGVWWVELDALRDATQVARTVAQALNVREQPRRALRETLTDYLRAKRLLLVLDNCEHLREACVELCAHLLRECPELQILATSRGSLDLSNLGEVEFEVSALTYPTAGELPPLNVLQQFEAIQLFTERTREKNPSFALTAQNASQIAQICLQLDGIPLALELAAARLKTISLDYLADHLAERFSLLTGGDRTIPRHQTLRAVIDWSYDLLDPTERSVLQQLSVFVGRFTFEALEAVCQIPTDGIHVRDVLSSLVDQSLVEVTHNAHGDVLYRLLETIRIYGREKLNADPLAADAAFMRMARYYLKFAQTHQKDYLQLEGVWENILQGIRASHRQKRWEEMIAFGYAVSEACFALGFYSEARQLYPWICEAAENLEEQEAYIASMLNWGQTYIEQGFYPEAQEIFTRLLRMCRDAEDRHGSARALLGLAQTTMYVGQYALAEQHLRESRTYWERLEEPVGIADTIYYQARIAYRNKQYAQAEQLAQDALNIHAALPLSAQKIAILRQLALSASWQHKYEVAEPHFRLALEGCKQLQNRREEASVLYDMAQMYHNHQEWDEAHHYARQSLPLMQQFGSKSSEGYVLTLLCMIDRQRQRLSDAISAGEQSLAIAQRLSEPVGMVFAAIHLGDALHTARKTDEACSLWRDALQIAERSNLPVQANELRTRLDAHGAQVD